MYSWNRKRAANSDMCHKSRAPLAVRIFMPKKDVKFKKRILGGIQSRRYIIDMREHRSGYRETARKYGMSRGRNTVDSFKRRNFAHSVITKSTFYYDPRLKDRDNYKGEKKNEPDYKTELIRIQLNI